MKVLALLSFLAILAVANLVESVKSPFVTYEDSQVSNSQPLLRNKRFLPLDMMSQMLSTNMGTTEPMQIKIPDVAGGLRTFITAFSGRRR